MKLFSLKILLGLGVTLGAVSVLQANPAIPASSCAPDFSSCLVYEDQNTLFPDGFVTAAGDVLIEDATNTIIADFRVFNDFFDSGGGTGLGDYGFLYSAAFGNLPDPSTYSVNAVTVPLGTDLGNGFDETVYIGGFGTEYDIFTLTNQSTGTPEPSSLGFMAMGGAALALLSCKQKAH